MGVQDLVEGAGGRQVRPERLLDDDAGSAGQAGTAEHGHRGLERGRRDREVEQPPRRAADAPLGGRDGLDQREGADRVRGGEREPPLEVLPRRSGGLDRKSTRLNSSHPSISYAVFCLKKKTTRRTSTTPCADVR